MNDTFPSSDQIAFDRRKFILNSLRSAGGLALLSLHPAFADAAMSQPKTEQHNRQYSVQEVIDIILKEGGLTPIPNTVDTIKAGQADQVVTGIVTTMFPTIAVIREAARRNANFIIAHEPTFYNHKDDVSWVAHNTVLEQKQQLLEQSKIAVWRFHDYCHALKPDAISYGFAKKAGWLPYFKTGQYMLALPSLSLQQLADHLKSSLGIAHVRVVGDLQQPCERIALLPGSWGGQRQISIAENDKPDVLVVGEISEWETAEYARDARLLGKKPALLILGHAASEDPGMECLVDWLQPKLPEIKISHLASTDPFIWL